MSEKRLNADADLLNKYRIEKCTWNEIDDKILSNALGMFELHAKQRSDLIRAYLLAEAIVFAMFASMWEASAYGACIIVAGANLILNLGFYAMDIRNLQLIHTCEDILKVSEARLVLQSTWHDDNKERIRFLHKCEKEKDYLEIYGATFKFFPITHRYVYYTIFTLMSILSLSGMGFSIYLLTQSNL